MEISRSQFTVLGVNFVVIICLRTVSLLYTMSLEFFIDIIISPAQWPLCRLSLYQKRVPGICPGGLRRPVRRADNLAAFVCRLSINYGSLSPPAPPGPVQACNGILLLSAVDVTDVCN